MSEFGPKKQDRRKPTLREWLALGAASATLSSGVGHEYVSNSNPENDETTTNIAVDYQPAESEVPVDSTVEKSVPDLAELEAQFEIDRDVALAELTQNGVEVAGAIAGILAQPTSGAEAYNGTSVGNKSAVIGPDGVFGTPDDNPTPESFMRYDKQTGELYFSSVYSHERPNDETEYVSARVGFKVADGNPITEIDGPPETEDFLRALDDPVHLQVFSLEAKDWNGAYKFEVLPEDELDILVESKQTNISGQPENIVKQGAFSRGNYDNLANNALDRVSKIVEDDLAVSYLRNN